MGADRREARLSIVGGSHLVDERISLNHRPVLDKDADHACTMMVK